jgi:hypothetical protein
MTLPELISALNDRGIGLSVRSDRLIVDSPRGALTPELKAELMSHKHALIASLESLSPYRPTPDLTPEEVVVLDAIVADPWPEGSLAELIEEGRRWNAEVMSRPNRIRR